MLDAGVALNEEVIDFHGLALEFSARVEKELRHETFNYKAFCFDRQVNLIEHPGRFKTFVKSRRAGATTAIAAKKLAQGTTLRDVNLGYITIDRGTAERLLWVELQRLSEDHGLGCHFDNQKLTVRFPHTRTILYLMGAKDRYEIQKHRGTPFYDVDIDEAQAIRESVIKELVEDVLEASLIDYNGRLTLSGTPPANCVGYFFDACHSDAWHHFHWTMRENPHIARKSGRSVEEIYAEHLARRQITPDDPSFMREWLGLFVNDPTAQVYAYRQDRNTYEELPEGMDWRYVLGGDLGFEDEDALAVWAFAKESPNLYLVEDFAAQHQDISEFARVAKEFQDKYKPVAEVIDAGALGKKINAELNRRFGLRFEPAEKTEKFSAIEIMNADFRGGFIKTRPDMEVNTEWLKLQRNLDSPKLEEDPRFPNNRADACLYAHRKARHFRFKAPEPKIVPNAETAVQNFWKDLEKQVRKDRRERERQRY